MGFGVDARCLAVACAKSAAVALLGIYDRFEKRIPGQETEHRTYRTNRVAVRTSASPCQYDEADVPTGQTFSGEIDSLMVETVDIERSSETFP